MDLKKFNVDQYVRNNMLIGLYEDDERVQGLKKQVKNLFVRQNKFCFVSIKRTSLVLVLKKM